MDDFDGAKEWFRHRSPETQSALCARAALRSFPTVSKVGADEWHQVSMPLLRALNFATVASRVRFSEEVLSDTTNFCDCLIGLSAKLSNDNVGSAVTASLTSAAVATMIFQHEDSYGAAATSVSDSSEAISSSASTAAGYRQNQRDAEFLSRQDVPSDIFYEELWFQSDIPSRFAPNLETLEQKWTAEPKIWSFWREWYQGFLEGRPLEWELMRRVALIDNAIWESGASAVAGQIDRTRAKFDLERHIGELDAELRRATFDRHGVGGNMPPGTLGDTAVAKELIIVWQPLENLKGEISKNDPDPVLLQSIIDALVGALSHGIDWCLKKGDLIVDTAIKWAIPAAGTGYLALNPAKLEAVIEAAKRLLAQL